MLVAASAGFACTAILNPRDDVQRCNTADDCDATGDPRAIAECRFDPEHMDLDTTEVDKICVAAFRDVSCNPDNYAGQGGTHPFRVAFDEANHYQPCPDDAIVAGCRPPPAMSCSDADLTENEEGLCDDPDIEGAEYGNGDFGTEKQDVLDAFCQSFFCEADWVCNEDKQCERCDPELPPGMGGCGTLFVAGAPSCIYPSEDQLDCGDGDTDLDEPRFGNCG